MYKFSIRFYCLDCPEKFMEVISGIAPLKSFHHNFSRCLDPAMAPGADVIIAKVADQGRNIVSLLKQKRTDADLLVLAEPDEMAYLAPYMDKIKTVWPWPMPPEMVYFQFRRWQETYKLARDYWERGQFLDVLLDGTPNLVWYKDKNGIHEKVNASFCAAVNKPREVIQGRGHAFIWDVETDDPACIESERIVMESRETRSAEETIQTGAGQRILVTYKSPLYDLDGSVMGTVGIGIDKTQERHYHDTLERNTLALETVFTAMDCGIIRHSLDGMRVYSVNRAALSLLGYTSKEDLEAHGFDMVSDCVLDEDKNKMRESIKQLKNAGDNVSFTYRVERSEGHLAYIMGNARLMEENGEIICQRFLLDCTAQKLQEEREKEEKERRHLELIRVLSMDYEMVCVIDIATGKASILQNNAIDAGNSSSIFASMTNFDDSFNLYINTLIHPEDRERVRRGCSLSRLVTTLRKSPVFYINYREIRDGQTRFFRLKAARSGTRGSYFDIVVGFQSVDEQTRLEMEQKSELETALRAAKKASEAKSVFLSNMSHDIRTPMNAIVGYSTLAMNHVEKNSRTQGYLKKIESSGKHLLNLINDILNMSHIESGKASLEEKLCPLPEMLRGLWNILLQQASAKNIQLRFDVLNIIHEQAYCDRLRLNQVLLNLLGNSIKYTEEGGDIVMRVTEKWDTAKEKSIFKFHIRDTGIGMSEEFLKRIYEPFERERNSTTSGIQGTGLGMTISRMLVEKMMGGHLHVASRQGEGTEFTVTLPLRVAPLKGDEFDLPGFEGKSALIVYADDAMAVSLGNILSEAGMKAVASPTAEQAFVCARKAAENGKPFDIYLLDASLPENDAVDLAERLRSLPDGDIAPIILGTKDPAGIREQALAAGVTSICEKPFFRSDLRNSLLPGIGNSENDNEDAEPAKGTRHGRILLAEDNPMNQEIATEILAGAGYEVEVADNGARAVEMMTTSDPGYYDIVLMDVQMPIMGGYAATEKIRALEDPVKAAIPIIALTANSFEEDRQEAIRKGMNRHIAKPIDFRLLFTALDEMLGKEDEFAAQE